MKRIIEFIEIAWKPAVEILILATIIYYLAGFLRRTRGWPVVIGFVVLLSLTILATLFEFQVLSSLLQWFFAFSAVAIIVIFQPEFRRLLAEIGTFSVSTNNRNQRQNIEEILQAVENLSELKIGALIAIENSMPLRDYVQNAVDVDCLVTREMLETIFFPNNAIHDGAVIIKGDRIKHAACILPLTQREDLSKSMGTRHRAAIGLSEETDAFIVVVSEETGAISYAYRGELIRKVSIETLRDVMTAELVPHSESRFFRKLRWLFNRTVSPLFRKEKK
ncbi:MAG: diadenylate cyclase CdaA [Verrucomicrobiae bacterium]|nr:diadenylate cyclase CdaA [Verrucomicrobiae bacterium]